MAEKKIIIEKQTMDYQGLFDLKELFLEIDQFVRQHGYDRFEKRNSEEVTEDGKKVFIELEPWKRLSDYAKGEMHIEMTFTDLKEVTIEHDGVQETLLKGKAHFKFQARMITDYEHKWEGTPVYQFIRTLVDKFIHKTQTNRFESEIMKDCEQLQEEIKAFLNLFRYKT